MTCTFKLTPSEVRQAIAFWAEHEYGKSVAGVSLCVENVCVGYGPGEHMEKQFTGAEVIID